jgi:hypothetical protein
MRRVILGCLAAGGLLVVGGCGSGAKTSSAALKPRLLPSSAVPGFVLQRTLDWSDPVDLVAQGVALPDSTRPSTAVKEFRDAHLEGASGEVIQKGAGLNATEIRIGVAKFSSTSDADKVRAWMHGQDLQQPCFSECAFTPRAMPLPGVPSSSAAIQTVVAHGLGSPTNYRAEFTIGQYLYWAWGQAGPSAKTQAQFKAGIELYYRHARQRQG